jgi:hypothetical protein
MTTVFKLRQGQETIDLYGNADGFQVRAGGWKPGRATQKQDGTWDLVDEVIKLRVNGDSHDDLADKLQSVDAILYEANKFANRSHAGRDAVWLHAKVADETTGRQSLVFNGKTKYNIGFFGPPVTPGNIINDMDLALTRHPFWETINPTTPLAKGKFLSTVGGGLNGTEETFGDVPGRINSIYVAPDTSQTTALTEVWLGFRSEELGNRNYFQSNWDCGDADVTLANNTTRVTGDSSAINSQYARWTPAGGADNNILPRATVQMLDITSYINDQNGTHLVLLRARASSGASRTFRVRMLSGYYDEGTDSKWKTGKRVLVPGSGVSAGDWYYYPVGFVNIPVERTATGVALVKKFALRAEAEEYGTGSGNLELDSFTLIPVSEGAMHISGAHIAVSGSNQYSAYLASSPDDELVAYNVVTYGSATDNVKDIQFDPYNWSVPIGSIKIIVAAQRATESEASDNMQVWFDYYPRWITTRGGE